MLSNIPPELRRLKQWVVAGADKVPINPRTGKKADPTDSTTWGSYEEATRANYKHIGFVLSKDDPYTIIDLDAPLNPEQEDRHRSILAALEGTYSEFSQSRTGVHIITRGSIPAGVRRDKVEVYSESRYMICTGDVLNARPIIDCQQVLTTLYEEMQSTATVDLAEAGETKTDDEILRMANGADNSDKFGKLWRGEWSGHPLYPSQSEADFALMAILGYYSYSNTQCRRLFRASELGQRDKAQRDKYLDYMLSKVRAHQPPPINLDELLKTHKAKLTRLPPPAAPGGQDESSGITITSQEVGDGEGGDLVNDDAGDREELADNGQRLLRPPGIIGELAEYFEASAIRPVPEIALGSAIALTAGVAGRAYNISGTGLNQYLVVLAKTGSGKEGAASGIDSIIAAVRETVPMADTFIGPSNFASGQALVRTLDVHPCFVAVLGEIGITLQHLCDPRAPQPTQVLKRVLLDLYTKSGWNKTLRPSVYSDSDKNTKMIQAPSVTLFGESTPETFYGGLDHSHILEGLVPRFSVIEYTGPRPDRNPNAFAPPPEELVTRFADICVTALTCRQNNSCCPVSTDSDAQDMLDQFDTFATEKINDASAEVDKHLWNRAHLKALKMAALLAVGCDRESPVVNYEMAEWACAFVHNDVSRLAKRFSIGDVGQGEHKQENDLQRAITEYIRMPARTRVGYKTPTSLLEEPLIPYHYLRRRCRMLASFKNDKYGAQRAMDKVLEDFIKQDMLVVVPGNVVWERYQLRTPVYALGGLWG